MPRLVYEILEIDRDRHWQFSMHRGSIHVLPVRMTPLPVVALHGVQVVPRGANRPGVPELAVDAGEVLAVIGPNGAGKSTLLRVMGLLEPPTAGSVRFQGEPREPGASGSRCGGAWRASSRSRSSPTPPSGTTWPSVSASAGWHGGRAAPRVEAWLDAARHRRIWPSRQARTLSGGEAQRDRAGPRARARARAAAARRAVLGAGPAHSRGAARRPRPDPAPGAHHHRAGDPRSRRGHGAGGPRRRPDGRPPRAARRRGPGVPGARLRGGGALRGRRDHPRRPGRRVDAGPGRAWTSGGRWSRWRSGPSRASGCVCASGRRT